MPSLAERGDGLLERVHSDGTVIGLPTSREREGVEGNQRWGGSNWQHRNQQNLGKSCEIAANSWPLEVKVAPPFESQYAGGGDRPMTC